jgi:site-specific recombinase XerD
MYQMLTRHVAGRSPEDHVFTRQTDSGEQPMTYSSAAFTVRWIAKRAGLVDESGKTRVTPHVLRATFITLALDAGVALEHVQDMAGHRQTDTTRSYDRARGRLAGMAEASAKVSQILDLDGEEAI